jgi:hypothetical protein
MAIEYRARAMTGKHEALAELIAEFLRTVGEASSTQVHAYLHRNHRRADIVAAMTILLRDHRVAVRKISAFRRPRTLWRTLEPPAPDPP